MSRLSDSFLQHRITAPCPGCGARNQATLRQIQSGGRITCRGCGKPITLKQEGRGIQDVTRAMDDLQDTLRRFGR